MSEQTKSSSVYLPWRESANAFNVRPVHIWGLDISTELMVQPQKLFRTNKLHFDSLLTSIFLAVNGEDIS